MKGFKKKILVSLVGIATALTIGYGTAKADMIIMKDGSKVYNYKPVKEDYYGVTVKNKEGKELYIPASKIKDYIITTQDIDEETANRLEEIKEIEDWGEEKIGVPKSDNFLVYDEGFEKYHAIYYCDKLRLPKEYADMKSEFYEKEDKALERKKELEAQGYDVFYRTAEAQANGSSISKSLLGRGIGRKAFVVLHENMHDHVDFPIDLDEGCANISGFFGTLELIEEKFGKDSEQYKILAEIIDLAYKDDELIIKHYNRLDEVLKSNIPEDEKLKKKEKILEELAEEESKLYDIEIGKSNNPCIASEMTYSRFAPLTKKVYEKAGSAKEAIKVLKDLSDFMKRMQLITPNQNEEDIKNFCKTYLEAYIAADSQTK